MVVKNINFKDKYMEDLKTKLEELLPRGYKLKIYDEISYPQNTEEEDKFTIICNVKLGSGTKAIDEVSTFIQPIMFTIYTEAGCIETAFNTFQLFFETYSHQIFTYSTCRGVITYSSPVIQRVLNNYMGEKRGMILMSGIASLSDSLIMGCNIYLDDEEYKPIAISGATNIQVETPVISGEDYAKAKEIGANNAFTVSFYMRDNNLCNRIMNLAHGIKVSNKVKYGVKFGSTIRETNCAIVSISYSYDPTKAMTEIQLGLIPKSEVSS